MLSFVDPAIVTGLAGTWAGMILPVVIKGSLILALCGAFNLVLRRASASTRHLLWTLSLVAILLLPIFVTGLPTWRVLDLTWFAPAQNGAAEMVAPVQPAVATAQTVNSTPPPTASAGPPRDMPDEVSAATETGLVSRLTSLSVTTWIFFVWQAGVLMLLGTIVYAAIRLWSLERNAQGLHKDGWEALLESLCCKLQIAKLPRLLRSHKELTPMTWGVRRARILLPVGCDRWTDEQRRQVLLHELAHVKRRDCLTHITAQLACLLYWFNPLVWLAARRMRVERERACDDQVLVTGVKASSYASNLLDIACSFGPERRTLAVSLGMARRSQISGRLLAVLDPKRRRLAPSRYLTLLAAAFTLAIALPLRRPHSKTSR
jgi:beta-lactamase regulating signal transducer with metallopeptidase domain